MNFESTKPLNYLQSIFIT